MNVAKIDRMDGHVSAEFTGGDVTFYIEDKEGNIISLTTSREDALRWAVQITGALSLPTSVEKLLPYDWYIDSGARRPL